MLSIYVRKLVVFVFTFYLFKDTSYFLATGWSLVQEVLMEIYKIKKLKKLPIPNKGL
jgi:hypothetical protein